MFTLDQVVPWGRSFDEYRQMLALSDAELSSLRILGCADGPASFNAEATRRGDTVISCDPSYQFTVNELRARISATYDQIMEEARRNADEFVWTAIRSVEDLGHVRMAAMRMFLDDFEAGKAEGRYVEASLPTLPFGDRAFDLALCSHFLFLYTDHLGEDFHRAAVRELCRVGREVRIFPLLALGGQPSPFVDTICDDARSAGHDVVIERVPYEFQRGGNEMMRVRTGAAPAIHIVEPATIVPVRKEAPVKVKARKPRADRRAEPASKPEPAARPAPVAAKAAPVEKPAPISTPAPIPKPAPVTKSAPAPKPEPAAKPDPPPAPKYQAGAFYIQLSSGRFCALRATRGPWDPALQHGGPPAALLGRVLESEGGPPGSRIARIAFDFFGPVPIAEVSIATSVVRPGRRLQVSEATMSVDGRVVLRATATHVLAEAGRSPVTSAPFTVPRLPAKETRASFPGVADFDYGEAIEWRFVEGGFDRPGPATVWTRCRIPIVGTALSGLERVLVMADAANGISAVLPLAEWTFVPIDLMVTLERLPAAEWVGMSSRTTVGPDGIGCTDTTLFDGDGVIGRALQTLYIAPR